MHKKKRKTNMKRKLEFDDVLLSGFWKRLIALVCANSVEVQKMSRSDHVDLYQITSSAWPSTCRC